MSRATTSGASSQLRFSRAGNLSAPNSGAGLRAFRPPGNLQPSIKVGQGVNGPQLSRAAPRYLPNLRINTPPSTPVGGLDGSGIKDSPPGGNLTFELTPLSGPGVKSDVLPPDLVGKFEARNVGTVDVPVARAPQEAEIPAFDPNTSPGSNRPTFERASGFEDTLARLTMNSIAQVPLTQGSTPPIPYGDDNRELPPVTVPTPVDTPTGDAPPFPLPTDQIPPLLGEVSGGGGVAGGGAASTDAVASAEMPAERPALVDLELIAIRFVDLGFPHKKLGPAYRVRFRNAGSDDTTAPFWIALAADNGQQPTHAAKSASRQIAQLKAGGELSVDIRLPWEVMTMGSDSTGRAVPFSTLFVSLDTLGQIAETDERNNAARLARGEIPEVSPMLFGTDRGKLSAGDTVILLGEGLGPRAGGVAMELAGVAIPLETCGWHHRGVQVRLPAFPFAKAVDVKFAVTRHDGASARPLVSVLFPTEGG
jgi:hypothetical protein